MLELPLAGPAAVLPSPIQAVMRAMRPHQWAKNGLVILPAALAHTLGAPAVWTSVAVAIAALSLCASGTYVVNDLLDREHDRLHPTKRHRPFASGALSARTGIVLAVGLIGAAFALAVALLPGLFVVVLGVYVAVTLAYSLVLKGHPLIDVFVLAGLYALRVVAGGAASETRLSEWLLAFSLFFFLGLAFLKRYVELRRMETGDAPAANGRGYLAGDASLVRSVGPATGLFSALVLALYLTSPEVRVLYAKPEMLWAAIPPILFWTMRMWLLAHRGQMNDDPVLYAVRDPGSYAVAAVVAVALFAAS